MISAPARNVLSSCLTLELGDLSKLGVVGELHPERQGVFMAATRLVFSGQDLSCKFRLVVRLEYI